MPRRLHTILRIGVATLVATSGIVASALTANAQLAPPLGERGLRLGPPARCARVQGGVGGRVPRASGPASNRAAATAACEGCRATAVALQIVLADATSSAVDVANQALAVTAECRRCRADAYAFQFVVTALGRVELDGRGWGLLQTLAKRLVLVVRSGVAPGTMGAG